MPITSLDQLDLSKQYSYADYLTWRLQERIELIRGYIRKMSPAPSRRHQMLLGNFHLPVKSYFRHQPCQVFLAPFDVRLPRKHKITNHDITTVVQPDLCVICDPTKLDDAGCVGAPDWVIEILSKGNTKKEMREKFDAYEEAGVREYWVVQPEYDNILVYVLDKQGHYEARPTLDAGDEAVYPHIFPELIFSLTEVFEE